MNIYEVRLVSKEANVFETIVQAKNVEEAEKISLEVIKEKGWTQYEYQVYSVRFRGLADNQ